MLRKIKGKKWKKKNILWEKSAWIAPRGIAPGSFKIPALCILYTAGLIGGQLFGGGLDSKGY